MDVSGAPMRRVLNELLSPAEMASLHEAAKRIHAEQLAGHAFTWPEFYTRLLVHAGLPAAKAARIARKATAEQMPEELATRLHKASN